MQNIDDICIPATTSVKDALYVLDQTGKQILLVVDTDRKLLGTINDGDVRRGLLKGIGLNDSVEKIYFTDPTVANINDSKEYIISLASKRKIHQIPLLDNSGALVSLAILDELVGNTSKSNKVVLMAGGLGTRLGELTKTSPKPMLHVGNKPILQTIIENFAKYGYTEIILSVNYLSHLIEEYFGDGSRFGVSIRYIHETDRMGTAGALSLMRDLLNEPFFVMNADILTNVNFEHLHDHHMAQKAMGTMCVREYDFQVPYGVVNVEEGKITSIIEKPVHKFYVSGGIYMLSPEVLQFVPDGKFFDMPSLFEKVIASGGPTSSFPLHEYWMDIGQMNDYEQANNEYHEVF